MVPERWLIATDHIELDWPQNVWIGFSAEDQSNFDFRIESALKIPTPVLWTSAEPLLGEIDMSVYLDQIHWVIAGGESGPDARPTNEMWVKRLALQTRNCEVPFFLKQWGEWVPMGQLPKDYPLSTRDFTFSHTWSHGGHSYKIGRKKAGRLLDGEEFSEFPDYVGEYQERLLETEEANYQNEEYRTRHP
jgi:protein gp37